MIVPFIALIVVFAVVVIYFIANGKSKDKGNRPNLNR
jgi:hypothetical protein